MPLDAPVTMASLRELMALLLLFLFRSGHLGLQDDLGVGVLLVVPVAVHLSRLLERSAVRDEESSIDLPLLDHLEQRLGVFLDMGLARLHGQPLLHQLAQREFVGETAVHARNREASALAAGEDRLAQRMRTFG